MPLTSKGEEIKSNMEKEYGPSKGEQVFYASKNAGRISGVDSVPGGGCDSVPIAKCYDQSYPPMDPTSIGAMPTMERGVDVSKKPDYDITTGEGQKRMMYENRPYNSGKVSHGFINLKKSGDYGADPIGNGQFKMVPSGEVVGLEERNKRLAKDEEPTQPSGMQEPTDAEQTREQRERLRGELRYGKARHEGKITGREHQGFVGAVHQNNPEPHADASFDDAMSGYFGGAPDFSGDARSALGGAPEVVTQRQMANFASNFNYGQKGSPY